MLNEMKPLLATLGIAARCLGTEFGFTQKVTAEQAAKESRLGGKAAGV